MREYTERSLRSSFVNCSKGAASRIQIPPALLSPEGEPPFLLAWSDPKSPQTAYLVADSDAGLRGIVMEKRKNAGSGGARMCQLCLTLHPSTGVSLMSIPTAKSSRDNYGSVGAYLCTELACVDYTLGRKKPDGVRQMEETLTVDERIARTVDHAVRLIDSVAQKVR